MTITGNTNDTSGSSGSTDDPGRSGAASRTVAGNGSAAWSGRFNEAVSERVQRYTASIGFDQRLLRHDMAGSLAHARMLARCALISASDLADIE